MFNGIGIGISCAATRERFVAAEKKTAKSVKKHNINRRKFFIGLDAAKGENIKEKTEKNLERFPKSILSRMVQRIKVHKLTPGIWNPRIAAVNEACAVTGDYIPPRQFGTDAPLAGLCGGTGHCAAFRLRLLFFRNRHTNRCDYEFGDNGDGSNGSGNGDCESFRFE